MAPTTLPPRYRKRLLALAVCASLAPAGAWALDLLQAPPGNRSSVRPNVFISIDDSSSMGWRLDSDYPGDENTSPLADGTWPLSRKRMSVLKYALKSIFDPTHPGYQSGLVPNDSIRLAWQSMNNQGAYGSSHSSLEQARGSVDISFNASDPPQVKPNSIKVLDAAHRQNFLNYINDLSAAGDTPGPRMFAQVDMYLRRALDQNSPWAMEPGVTGAPYLGCRRNYHLFMTDGQWNQALGISDINGDPYPGTAALNADDHRVDKTLPDGQVYGSTDPIDPVRRQTNLYTDTQPETLSDWAFRSWALPLQRAADLTGAIVPPASYQRAPATESFGLDTSSPPKQAVLERYWNPKYDPATWAHVNTYTIGFSQAATRWGDRHAFPPVDPQIDAPSTTVPFGWDGSLPDLITGNKKWPAISVTTAIRGRLNSLDLWHASLNGRGRFYAVEKGEDLAKAFREIFARIHLEIQPAMVASATSGSNVSNSPIGRFIAGYDPAGFWKGEITAQTIATGGVVQPAAGWGGQSTANKLDAAGFNVSNRLVLSYSDKMGMYGRDQGGVSFQWAGDESKLSNAQKLWLQKNSVDGADEGAAMGQNRLDYVRGERSLEGTDPNGYSAAKPFRERLSRQGDIINSQLWYTHAPNDSYALPGYAAFLTNNKTRTPMLYVGGNDGMLHGFSATDGAEKIAYVPKGVIPALRHLSAPAFNQTHQPLVDGSPMTGDVDISFKLLSTVTPSWRTLLVGTLGAGGKGYFVLDVTNSGGGGSGADGPAFGTANASALVHLDRTRHASEPAPDCITGLNADQQAACNKAWVEAQDIGHITALPVTDDANPLRSTQITRMNDGRWAVLMGNGYNSANQRPVLLVQYLDGAQELRRLPATTDAPGTGNASDNGLNAPRVLDVDGNGTADVVYAGDNLGNLWKFDLTSSYTPDWRVAFGGAPLFTATGPATLGGTRNLRQPITAAPTVRANDRKMEKTIGGVTRTVAVGGVMVAFGTGRNVAVGDPESRKVQTLYSVLDNTSYSLYPPNLMVHTGNCVTPNFSCTPAPRALGTGVDNAKLAKQSITVQDAGAFGTVDASQALSASTWSSYNGWYLDLPAAGERVLQPMRLFDGSNILAMYSVAPTNNAIEESCSNSMVPENQYLTFVNIMDGKRPSVQLIDYNNDGLYNSADAHVARIMLAGGPHNLITDGNKTMDIDSSNKKTVFANMPEASLRPSWRQLR